MNAWAISAAWSRPATLRTARHTQVPMAGLTEQRGAVFDARLAMRPTSQVRAWNDVLRFRASAQL